MLSRSTASQAAAPDSLAGYGLINVASAMQGLCAPAPGGLVHAITCTQGPTPFDANITFSATGGALPWPDLVKVTVSE